MLLYLCLYVLLYLCLYVLLYLYLYVLLYQHTSSTPPNTHKPQVPTQRILVVYDDLDLDAGVVRFRMKGGHGGHNGMRSIIHHLGNTHDFPRVRIGISRPPGQQSVASYVLEPFSKAQREEIEVAVHEAAGVVKTVLQVGVEKAASGVRV